MTMQKAFMLLKMEGTSLWGQAIRLMINPMETYIY